MTTPINVFKTYTANLTPTSTTVYTTPSGYTSIVLLAQISNTSESTISVTSDFIRSSVPTNLIKNGLVPKRDAINIIGGKLILDIRHLADRDVIAEISEDMKSNPTAHWFEDKIPEHVDAMPPPKEGMPMGGRLCWIRNK